MATAATVTIRMDADSIQFVRELEKANESANRTFGNIKQQALDVATQVAAVGAAAIAAFAALAKASFESADALAKTADRMGLATETMKTFQVAADLAGVSQEKLEKALLKQQQAIVGAVDGNVQLQQTFRNLGVSAQELINIPVDQQFSTIAEALSDVDNVARRNALALDVWGAKAVEMINLAQAGGLSLAEMQAQLVAMNAALSRVDAAKIEQANDAVSFAKQAFVGLGNTIAVAVAPVIEGLARDFTKAAVETNGFRKEVQTTMDQVVSGVTGAVNAVQFLGLTFGLFIDAVQFVGSGIAGVLTEAFRTVGEVARLVFIDPVLWGLQQIAIAQGKFADLMDLPGLAQRSREGAKEIQNLREALRNTSEMVATMGSDVIDYSGAQFKQGWGRITKAFEEEWAGTAWERRYQGYVDASKNAATQAADALNRQTGADTGNGALQELSNLELQRLKLFEGVGKNIKVQVPRLDLPQNPYIDPEVVQQATVLSTQAYLEAWQLANEQRLQADQVLKETMYQSDLEAGNALIELAGEQARARVQAEFEARGQGFDEEGNPTDPAARQAYEVRVQEETLQLEQEYLNRRLQLQSRFGQQYIGLQQTMQKLFGRSWADTHKTTLNSVAAFTTAAVSIGQALFGENKKVAIATALISTYTAAAKAIDIYGPTPQGFAAAAAALATGFAQVRSIQSTSASGSGAVGGGLGGTLSAGTPAATPLSPAEQAAGSKKATQVIFQGDFYGWDDFVRTRVLDSIREAVSEQDVIIIDPRSRNAKDLVGG